MAQLELRLGFSAGLADGSGWSSGWASVPGWAAGAPAYLARRQGCWFVVVSRWPYP
jgi:hypothetical protein